MIAVSAVLKAEILKPRGRLLLGRVRIDYSDANIDNTIVSHANTTQKGTQLRQVYNGKEDVTHKWASLDGSWTLNGEYFLMPDSEEDLDDNEIGWWGHELSLPDGTFAATHAPLLGSKLLGDSLLDGDSGLPELSVNFLPRTVSEIRIAFDNAREEYGVDFDVILTNAAGATLHTESVVGNSGLKYVAAITPVNLVCQMTLRLSRWSHPGRQPKIAEMFTAISELYEGRDLFKFRWLENRELSDEGVSLGQTASGECVVTLPNRNRAFDYDNTASKLFNVIRDGNRITLEIGNGTEWIPLGVYFARAWDIDKRSMYVTVTGLDRMAQLDESEFSTNQIIEAPADETYETNTQAEWAGGDLEDVQVDGDSIRMVF